jgi:hypothetical protein
VVVFLVLLAFKLSVQEAVRAFSEYGLEALVIGFFVHHG